MKKDDKLELTHSGDNIGFMPNTGLYRVSKTLYNRGIGITADLHMTSIIQSQGRYLREKPCPE